MILSDRTRPKEQNALCNIPFSVLKITYVVGTLNVKTVANVKTVTNVGVGELGRGGVLGGGTLNVKTVANVKTVTNMGCGVGGGGGGGGGGGWRIRLK